MLQILTIQLTGQPLTQIQEITGKLAVGILRWVSKQWGTGASGKNNLPISFNNILCALAVPNSPLYTYETSITSINKSYINIKTWSNNYGSSTVYYIAIGN